MKDQNMGLAVALASLAHDGCILQLNNWTLFAHRWREHITNPLEMLSTHLRSFWSCKFRHNLSERQNLLNPLAQAAIIDLPLSHFYGSSDGQNTFKRAISMNCSTAKFPPEGASVQSLLNASKCFATFKDRTKTKRYQMVLIELIIFYTIY